MNGYAKDEKSKRAALGLNRLLKPFKGHKTKRDKLNRAYSLVADSEVTPGSLEVWSDLPEEIKYDPSLAPFKNLYEKQYGMSFFMNIFYFFVYYMRKYKLGIYIFKLINNEYKKSLCITKVNLT